MTSQQRRELWAENTDKLKTRVIPFSTVEPGDSVVFAKRAGFERVCHADTNCPHFPGGRLVVYPVSRMRTHPSLKPCGYCTLEKSGKD